MKLKLLDNFTTNERFGKAMLSRQVQHEIQLNSPTCLCYGNSSFTVLSKSLSWFCGASVRFLNLNRKNITLLHFLGKLLDIFISTGCPIENSKRTNDRKQLEGHMREQKLYLLRDRKSYWFEHRKPSKKLGRQIRCLVSEFIIQMPHFCSNFFYHLLSSPPSSLHQISQFPRCTLWDLETSFSRISTIDI